MKITFAGAADTVTGSCHLIELDGLRVLLDCGMFQGPRPILRRNLDRFPFEPASIDWMILSHAHLDHTGRLPLLVKQGFRGRILSTAATRDLARIIMLDSARLQEADAIRARKKGFDLEEDAVMPVLYREEDVFRALERFRGKAQYDEPHDLGQDVSVVFRDAGHVMGSAFIELAQTTGGRTQRLTFSGDLGNVDKPLIRDPAARTAPADALLMESTYGTRNHRPFAESVGELEAALRETFERGGVVVIPAFALERSQELLYVLYQVHARGDLSGASVYLDSPMAIEVTQVMSRHPDCLDAEAIELLRAGGNPFGFEGLRSTSGVRDSKAINADRGPAIIIAGSGMCTGGRILHHLRHRLPHEENAIVFIGYQAEGTLGREIVEGAELVRVHNRTVPVRAAVHTIGGFSGHAGRDTLLHWLDSAEAPDRLFLVHGEADAKRALATDIHEQLAIESEDPKYGATIEL